MVLRAVFKVTPKGDFHEESRGEERNGADKVRYLHQLQLLFKLLFSACIFIPTLSSSVVFRYE
jgi:hypothetical protein